MSTLPASVTAAVLDTRQLSVPRLAYRPDVDGLRAVAILSVLGFHLSPDLLPGGFCGVDVFFVISGYLITGIVLQELRSDRFSFRQFYARRARRLFPALVLVLVTTFSLGWLILLPDEFQKLGSDAAAGAAFSSNLYLYTDTQPYFFTANRPLLHLWSLGVEEQFYFLWPALVYAAWNLDRRWIWVIAMGIFGASFFANISIVSFDSPAAFYLPWNRLWELSFGAALISQRSILSTETGATCRPSMATSFGWTRQQQLNICGFVGIALVVTSLMYLNGALEYPGWWGLVPSMGAALIILSGPQSWVARNVLSRSPVVFIGLISYPLYLWHWSLLCFARLLDPSPRSPLLLTLGVVLLALVLSAATYRFVEIPVRYSRANPRILVTVCVALTCCGLVGYMISIQYIPARRISRAVERLVLPSHEDWLSTKNTEWTVLPKDFVEIGGSPTKTLFIGDSFMEQYYPRIAQVVELSAGQTNSAVFAVRGACSLPYEFSWAYGHAGCKRHIEKALAYAKRNDVDTVVVASAWPGYFMAEDHGEWQINRDALPALDRFRKTITELRGMQKRVYIVLTAPMDETFDPRDRIQRTVDPPGFRVVDVKQPSKAELQKRYAAIESLLKKIAQDTDAIIIDPTQELCSATTCPATTTDGEPIYHDAAHLRPSFVRHGARFMDETVVRFPLSELRSGVR